MIIIFKESNDVWTPVHAYLTVGFILRRLYPVVLKSNKSFPMIVSNKTEGGRVITWGWCNLQWRSPHE